LESERGCGSAEPFRCCCSSPVWPVIALLTRPYAHTSFPSLGSRPFAYSSIPATRSDRCAARGRAHATLGRAPFTRGLAKATTLASRRSTFVEPDRHRPPAVAGRDGVVVVPAAAAAPFPDPVVTFLTNEVTEGSSSNQEGYRRHRPPGCRKPGNFAVAGLRPYRPQASLRAGSLGERGPEMPRGSRTPGCRPARPAGCRAAGRPPRTRSRRPGHRR
jgi:hypothetical protein